MGSAIITPKGIYRDVLTAPNGAVLHDSGWKSNTIVESCRILLAGFVKHDAADGLLHLQVGEGEEAWDTTGAPPPPTSATALIKPAVDAPIAFADLDVAYMSASGTTLLPGEPPTPQLHITAVFDPGYPAPVRGQSYPLREFGLFGSFGGVPFMINNVRHTLIMKEVTTTLTRVVRLYF